MCKTDETGCRQIRAFENFEFRDLHLLLVTFVCLRRRWWRLRNGVWHRQNRRSPWFDDSWMLENVWSLQCGRLGLGWKLLDLTVRLIDKLPTCLSRGGL